MFFLNRLCLAQIAFGFAPVALSICASVATAADGAPLNDPLRAQLREHLRKPEFTLGGKAEYVVADPAFIEPVLDKALRYRDATKPLTPAELDRAQKSAVTYYRLGLAEPHGLRALETLIAARFAKPVVKRALDAGQPPTESVELDFGWMIGALTKSTRGIEHDRNGAHVENGLPATRLLAGLLADAARAYPKAGRVSVLVTYSHTRRLGNQLRAAYYRGGAEKLLTGWVIVESATPTASRSRYQVWAGDDTLTAYREGHYSFYENCAPAPGVGRTPTVSVPSDAARQRCLNYARDRAG